jgi:hypothetical protein
VAEAGLQLLLCHFCLTEKQRPEEGSDGVVIPAFLQVFSNATRSTV